MWNLFCVKYDSTVGAIYYEYENFDYCVFIHPVLNYVLILLVFTQHPFSHHGTVVVAFCS